MAFKPSLHGWGFEDAFEIDGAAIGLSAAPAGLGLGGGMCWAALDRYLDGRTIPDLTTAPGAGSPLHSELRHRQVAALAAVLPRLREWQSLPDGSWRDRLPVPLTPGRSDIASLTRREWPGIRRSLRKGRPVLLTLVTTEDGYTRAVALRQVLACDFTREGGRVTLSIYDPARPGEDEVQLGFSTRGALDARLTGGERVRGFFAVPYDREPAAALRGESFGDRTVLGLNRKIHGRPAAAAARRTLHMVARDVEGALLHFYRRNGRPWEGANVTEREELEGVELHCDPVAVSGPGMLGLHAFGRTYIGDLLHFRGLRRWKAANRTDTRRAGPRFRLEGNPVAVALPWGGVCVVGRGKDGALITYGYQPFRGWRADEVPAAGGGVVTGDPMAVALGGDVHVVARGRDGHVLHFERTRGGWSSGDLTTQCPGAEPAKGLPFALVSGDRLHVLVRTQGDRLLHMERNEDGQWEGRVVAEGVAGDPVAANGPAGLHVFAAGTEGGLVHAWGAGKAWRVEDIVATRAALAEGPAPGARLLAWGSADELRIFGQVGERLVQWVWRGDADWVAGPLSERAGVAARHEPRDPPQLIVDAAGAFHLVATDGSGTAVHLEPGEWVPARDAAAAARAGRARVAKAGRVKGAKTPASAKPAAGAEKPAASPNSGAEKPAASPKAAPAAADPPSEGEWTPDLLDAPDTLGPIETFEQPAGPGPAAAGPAGNGTGRSRSGKVEKIIVRGARPLKDEKSASPPKEGKATKNAGNGANGSNGSKGKPARVAPVNRVPAPSDPGLPLLDDPEPEEETDSAMDLPLLEPTPEDQDFDWERAPDKPKSPQAETDVEPFDLETLENWPPTVDSPRQKPKKPDPGRDADPPLPWPEEG